MVTRPDSLSVVVSESGRSASNFLPGTKACAQTSDSFVMNEKKEKGSIIRRPLGTGDKSSRLLVISCGQHPDVCLIRL